VAAVEKLELGVDQQPPNGRVDEEVVVEGRGEG
jgi:hypothetical protein